MNSVSEIALPLVIEMIDAAVAASRAPELILIQGVNWSISAGDYWVVAGLPETGKSELLAVAAGVQRLASGTLRLFGQDIAGLSEEALLQQRLNIGLVFQLGGRLFSHLTVAENVALALCYHRNCTPADAWEQVEAVLEITGLTALASQSPQQLNRGWRQRVGLARALALKPVVLLLENLLVALESRQTQWWMEFLARLSTGHEFMDRRPVTLIVATHDLDLWRDQGKQFALLSDNRLRVLGGRADLAASEEPLLQELRMAAASPGPA